MQQIFATLVSFVAVAKTRAEEEKGATAVEYGLLVGLIAVAIIVTVACPRRKAERSVHERQGRAARRRRAGGPLIRSS